MKISIITVSYNSARTILETCHSVRAQSYRNYEHLVIDGKSTDDTISVIDKCRDDNRVVLSEPDAGIYDAMNKGIRLAQGDVIGFINADDTLAHNMVFHQVREVFANPETLACYADLDYVNGYSPFQVNRRWRCGGPRINLLGLGWIPPHPTFYCRRSVYRALGGFDLSYKLAADHELLSRYLLLLRGRVQYIPSVWVKMKIGGATNKSISNVLKQNIEIISGLCRNKITPSVLFPLWKISTRFRERLAAVNIQ